MPYNGVVLTRMVERYQPKYLLFIGTCAGFKKAKKVKKGGVLIPGYIYEYGSGKHHEEKFDQEFRPYNVSSALVTFVGDMVSKQKAKYKFKIVHEPNGFCSGASVVDSKKMKKAIEKTANRKVLGFDMEAYVVAVINDIYKPHTQALVIKGIMDFGENKNDKDKKKAIRNSSKIAHDLIIYMVNNKKI